MALSRAIQELIDLLSTPSQEKKVETMSKTDKKPSHVNEPDFENYGGPHIANITAEFQYREAVTPEYSIVTGLKHIHFNEPSEFQDVKVIETTAFGRTLILDLHTQSAEFDEHLYHESLVHPAMISHPNPQTVFIGGGGELATAREVLKHSGVKECIMVDLDKKVVDASLLALPSMVGNVMSDKRLKVEYGDAKAYLEKCDIKFDVIIMDIADPIEAGPGIACYFKSFYQTIHDKLNDNGCFVTQSGPCGFMTYDECFTVIHNTMKSVFKDVNGYFMEVPSFGCPWGWNIGWKSGKPKFFDNMKDIDDQLVKHVGNETFNQLKHYDGSTHFHMFSLPKHLRIALKEEKRVMTKDTPVFMY